MDKRQTLWGPAALAACAWASLLVMIGLICFGHNIDPRTRLPVPNAFSDAHRHLFSLASRACVSTLVVSCLLCPVALFRHDRRSHRQWEQLRMLAALYVVTAVITVPLILILVGASLFVPGSPLAILRHDTHLLLVYLAAGTLEMFFFFVFIPVTLGVSTIRLCVEMLGAARRRSGRLGCGGMIPGGLEVGRSGPG